VPSALLVLAFGSVLAAGLLLTSSLRNRGIGEILDGLTSPNVAGAQEALGANTSGGTAAPAAPENPVGAKAAAGTAVGSEAYGFFRSVGLSSAAAAGIVGNLEQESSLNPHEAGGYLAQWGGSRLKGLEAFAAKFKEPVTTARVQLAYIWNELTTNESGTLKLLKQAKTPQAAARVFSQHFERPGIPDLSNRERYAGEAYAAYGAA
jgi:hypothetical protein